MRSYWLRGIPRDHNGDIGKQIKTHWEGKGFKLTRIDGLDTSEPAINGYTKPDEFLISRGIESQVKADPPQRWDGTMALA